MKMKALLVNILVLYLVIAQPTLNHKQAYESLHELTNSPHPFPDEIEILVEPKLTTWDKIAFLFGKKVKKKPGVQSVQSVENINLDDQLIRTKTSFTSDRSTTTSTSTDSLHRSPSFYRNRPI
jgi:hypothetical protein